MRLDYFFLITFANVYPAVMCMCCMTDMSPPSHQAEVDPFASFLSSGTSTAAPSQTAAAPGSEMFGSTAPIAQTSTSTKDAIMALYGNSAMAAGPYGMPSAGMCN